jgi:hypothetical protein
MVDLVIDIDPTDRALLVRLPFRVGMWMSQVDQSGGDESADAERVALETIVTAYAEDYLKSEFVQSVMEQTVAGRAHWSEWTGNLARVPRECAHVIKAIKGKVPDGDFETFKHNLLEIAAAVAIAFCEIEGDTKPQGAVGFLHGLLFGGGRMPAAKNIRISPIEQKALIELTEALGLPRSALGDVA